MARVKRGVTGHARHKKVLAQAKGYVGRSSKTFRPALERLEKALRYAYRDRRARKRDFRGLWIQRINAGARAEGLTYGELIHGLKLAAIAASRSAACTSAGALPSSTFSNWGARQGDGAKPL